MKNIFTLFLLALTLYSSAQEAHMYERRFDFLNGELVQSHPEQSTLYDTLGIGNFSYGMNNLMFYYGNYMQVFSNAPDENPTMADVYFRKSDDGLNWSDPVIVTTDNVGSAGYATITMASSKGSAVVVSYTELIDNVPHLKISYSYDEGDTWEPSIDVAQAATGMVALVGQVVIDPSFRLYAFWMTTNGGCWQSLYYTKSEDFGSTWTPEQIIYSGMCYSSMPSVEVGNSGHVMVALYDDQFYTSNVRIVRTSDGGDTWETNTQSTNTTYPQGIYFVAAALDNEDNAYTICTYANSGDPTDEQKILSSVSQDFGDTWAPATQVNDVSPIFGQTWFVGQMITSVAVTEPGIIFATWSDTRNDLANDVNFDTYLAWSTDYGVTWNEDILVNEDISGTFQAYASVAAYRGADTTHVVVTWMDNRCEGFDVSIMQDGNVMSTDVIADSYQWFLDGNEIFGANASYYEGTEDGVYTVQATIAGCTASSDTLSFVLASIGKNGLHSFSAYPNPVIDELNITSSYHFSAVIMRDAIGRIVFSESFPQTTTRTLDLSSFASGWYSIEVPGCGKRVLLRN